MDSPEIILKDGVRYIQHDYQSEAELEEIFIEHMAEIFGPEALLFPKKKIKSRAGVGGIPDAFVIDLAKSSWFVIEVELASHPLYDHVVHQMAKFNAGISNPTTLSSLKKAFYEEVTDENRPKNRLLFDQKGISEIYKTISDILEKDPLLEIIVDGWTQEAREVMDALPFETDVIEFLTYFRGGTVPEDHAHRFVPACEIAAPGTPPPAAGTAEKREGRQGPATTKLADDHTKKSIAGFRFRGEYRPADIWKAMLLGVCNMIHDEHPDEFERVLELTGKKNKWFSRDREDLRNPKRIPGTEIYVDTHLSANDVCKRTVQVLELFGYSADDVEIIEQGSEG